MNIFLPYEHDIDKSVESLDDRRLIKQILECHQLLNNAIKEKNGEEIKGYKNHPIYLHYKKNISFLIEYGIQACREYCHRFQKKHNLYDTFTNLFFEYDKGLGVMWYVPFYMQGSKYKPDCIRTTHYVSKLYQNKLCEKWNNDKLKGRPPKWTNREIPSFYKEIIGEQRDEMV